MSTQQKGLTLIEALVLLLIIGIVAGMFPIDISAARERARRAKCMSNLAQIGKAAAMYEMDYTNRMQTLESITNYANKPKFFICPSSGHVAGMLPSLNQWTDYAVVSGITTNSPGTAVHAYCRMENHRGEGGNVLLVDGAVDWVTASDFWNVVSNGWK